MVGWPCSWSTGPSQNVRHNYSMKRFSLIAILSFSYMSSFACTCLPLDSVKTSEIFESSDFVVQVQVIESIHIDSITKTIRDEQGYSEYAKGIVRKTWKGGPEIGDVIYLLQSDGSCNESFAHGKEYLVFGEMFRKLVAIDQPQGKGQMSLITTYTDQEELAFYQSMIDSNHALLTNECASFLSTSKTYREIVSFIK